MGHYLRGWRINVPEGHYLSADPRAFLEVVRPKIYQKLVDEVQALKGVKFQLTLRVLLRKDKSDGSAELTNVVLRHKQEVLLQIHEISETLDRAFPSILETLAKWTQNGSGRVVE